MADETIIDSPEETQSQQRIKQLNDKVRLTSEERDEKNRLLEESNKKIVELERENAFNSGYADVLGSHSAAKDHKDDIKAKVLTGMSVEDATFAVLGKAGKLGATPNAPEQNIAGGSASTAIPQGGTKNLRDMTRDEKRAAILEAEKNGDIALS